MWSISLPPLTGHPFLNIWMFPLEVRSAIYKEESTVMGLSSSEDCMIIA